MSHAEMIHPLIRPAREQDGAGIAAIYNDAILARIATFETRLRSAGEMVQQIAASERHPMLVAVKDEQLLGWASIAAYRSRDCYAGIGEFSVYVTRAARGQRIGTQLLDALVRQATALGYWKLLSRVFPFNRASLAMCRSCGFRVVGVYERHGQLDGRWLDVVIVERLIPENQPENQPGNEPGSQSEDQPEGGHETSPAR